MAGNNLDPLMAMIDYELLEMLISFNEHGTFAEVEKSMNITEKTVRSRLKELNRIITGQNKTAILHQANARRWELTPAGVQFAENAKSITKSIRRAVESIEHGHRITVVTTSACCDKLSTLMSWYQDHTSHPINIKPRLAQSSAIEPTKLDADVDYALVATLVAINPEDPVLPGTTVPLGAGEMLVLDVDDVQVLTRSRGNVRNAGATNIQDLLAGNTTFCIPSAGVPWEYMQRLVPDWQVLKFQQYFPIDDLNQGLSVLASGIAGPRAVMLVHGIGELDPRLVRIPDPMLLPLESDGPRLAAATGLIRRPRRTYTEASDTVWSDAHERWEQLVRHNTPVDAGTNPNMKEGADR